MRLALLMLVLALPLAAQAPAAQWSGQFDYSTYGNPAVGSDVAATFTLTNTTGASMSFMLELVNQSSDNPGEPVCPFYETSPSFSNDQPTLIVPANSSVPVTVEWRPTIAGYESTTLYAIDSNGNRYPALLHGTAQ